MAQDNSDQLLASIIDNLPGHVYWKSKDSVYQGCNLAQAKSAGFASKNDVIGKTDDEMPWHKDADSLREMDRMVMQSQQTITREERSQLADSDKVSIFLSKKTPLFDKSGQVIGILGVSFDITDRKKMEVDLQEAKLKAESANHAKTEFIANMSHDIRTPLTGIIGMSQILEEEVDEPDEKQHAHWVHESGEHLLGLLTDVLDVVSADTMNEADLHLATFDLYRLMQDVIALEQAAVKVNKLDLKIHIDGAVPHYVVSDRIKIHRILLNLIGNAIKFTRKGHVAIEAQLISKRKGIAKIQFHVKDTGIGIPKHLQDKVFDRFFKVHPSYKGHAGHGVGLHIAEKFVDLLGGKLSLKSTEGVGTRFSFTLPMNIGKSEECIAYKASSTPVAQPSLPTVQPKKPATLSTPQAEQKELMQILLIEDNFLALQVLKTLVKALPAYVLEAADAESALPIVQAHPLHLIITDIGLPGQSGDELTQAIRDWERENKKTPIPIIGLTGHVLGEIAKPCLAAGMNQIYPKPMSSDLLKQIIKEFVKFHPDKSTPTPDKTTIKTVSYEDIKQGHGSISETVAAYAKDLPQQEAELLQLDAFSLFDVTEAIRINLSEDSVRELLKTLIDTDMIPTDAEQLKAAHAADNWEEVQRLAHRIKGGASYIGATRMKMACQYVERYWKIDQRKLLELLYQQVLQVMDDTLRVISKWVSKNT